MEFFIRYHDVLYRFYRNANGNLCFGKYIEAAIKRDFIVASAISSDFFVISNKTNIFCVYTKADRSLYLSVFDGTSWQNGVLMEACAQKAEVHGICGVTFGEFAVIFYVLGTNDHAILISQTLNGNDRTPRVADYVSADRFLVAKKNTESAVMLLYKNREREWGTKQYRWSEKTMGEFVSLELPSDLIDLCAGYDREDSLYIFYSERKSGAVNLYLKILSNNEIETQCIFQTSYADNLCITEYGQCIHLFWRENGLTVTVAQKNKTMFLPPKKYMGNTTAPNIRLVLQDGDFMREVYGYTHKNRVFLYLYQDFLKDVYSVADNAKNKEYVLKTEYQKEINLLKNMIAGQNELLIKLLNKTENVQIQEKFQR